MAVTRFLRLSRIGRYSLLILIVFSGSFLLHYGTALSADRFAISIQAPRLMDALKDRDRIVRYTVSVWGGRVVGVSRIEEDWHVEVHNDERPQIKAFAGHGASWFTAADAKRGVFKDFVLIQAIPDWGQLDVKVELTLDVFMKEEERVIVVEKKDILFTPIRD